MRVIARQFNLPRVYDTIHIEKMAYFQRLSSRNAGVTMKSQHGPLGLCFNVTGWNEQEGAMKRVMRSYGDSDVNADHL